MRKSMRRFLSCLFALALVVSLVSLLPAAEASPTYYELWLGSVQVTSDNKDNIPVKGGTAKFDPSTNTLTLTNVTGVNGTSTVSMQVGMTEYDTRDVLIQSRIPLTIKGSAVFGDDADFALYCGKLTVNANLTFNGYYDVLIDAGEFVMNGGRIYGGRHYNVARDFVYVSRFTLNGGEIELDAEKAEIGFECYQDAVFNNGTFILRNCYDGLVAESVTVNQAELFIETKGYPAVSANQISISSSGGSEITCPVNGKVYEDMFMQAQKDYIISYPDVPDAASIVYIQNDCYPLYVGRYRVTSHNKDAIPLEDDMYATYNPSTKTLSMDGLTVIGSWKLYNREKQTDDVIYKEALVHADGIDLTVSSGMCFINTVGSATRQIGFEVSGGKLIIAGNVHAKVQGAISSPYGGSSHASAMYASGGIVVKDGISLETPAGGSWNTEVMNDSEENVREATFRVNAPKITGQPQNTSVAQGKTATFKVTATGLDLKYQWEYKKAGESDWTYWDGKYSATVTCTAGSANNGCQYRCVIRNAGGTTVSNVAKLTTIFPPTITTQPANTTVVQGKTATFKVVASGTGLSYQWQYKKVGESGWTNWAGKTSATVTCTAGVSNNGCQYRCVVKNAAGSVTSNIAKLTTILAPSITTQPANTAVVQGKTATFKVAASGGNLSYQWQYKKVGESGWTNWSGKTAATVTCTAGNANNGCQYRCVVKNSAGSVTSNIAKLTTLFVPTITTQPANTSVAQGGTATFKVAATGGNLSYQWQYKKVGESGWTNWSGKTSATVTCTAGTSNNGCQYRCVVKNAAGSVTSSIAKLTTLTGAPVITTQPANTSVAQGSTATFKVVASGSNLTYQWQYKKVGESSWTNWSGKTSATVTCTAGSANNGCQYRCVVKNSKGSVTSGIAKLTTVFNAPKITTQPKNTSVNKGSTATFKVVATGEALSYQWQYKKVGESSWTNWSGKTSATVTCTAGVSNNGCQYRCVVKNAKGSVTSSIAVLTTLNP